MYIDRKKIELAMARKCISRSELSDLSKLNNNTLGVVLKRGSASPSTIGRIAKALDVDVTEILSARESEAAHA